MAAQPSKGWRYFIDNWLTVDTRALGVFRIACGVLLLTNLYDRLGGPNFISFYTNEGLLPNHYALFLPPAGSYWSLLLGLTTPNELRVAFALIFVVYLLYTLGWNTRWMQLFALVAYESVNNRFILIQHGGNVVVNVMLVWSLFLPLGERYSLDALLLSLRRHRDGDDPASLNARGWVGSATKQAVGLAYLGLCFNFAFIYFFNALHKMGGSWRDGTVIHWVLWQNRMATSLAALVRLHEPFWFSPALTWGTLVMEWSLPLLILIPLWKKHARAIAILFVWSLHGGIALLCTLGPFSYSMMVTCLILLQPEHFSLGRAWLKARVRTRRVRYRIDLPRQVFWARVLARLDLLGVLELEAGPRFEVVDGAKTFAGSEAVTAVMRLVPAGLPLAWAPAVFGGPTLWLLRKVHAWSEGTDRRPPRPEPLPVTQKVGGWVKLVAPAAVLVAVISQMLMENWGVHPAIKLHTRPAWMTAIVEYLTIPQGWSMFAPEPPREDARLVVDATLTDGTHLDLLTAKAPDFEPWLHGPWDMDQHWCEVHARMRNWGHHWRNFRDYLARTPQRQGWREGVGISDFEVFFVSNRSPAPGETVGVGLEKKRLFGMHDWP